MLDLQMNLSIETLFGFCVCLIFPAYLFLNAQPTSLEKLTATRETAGNLKENEP